MYVYIYIYKYINIYIYIYIYMGAALSPPCFLTTLQYTKLHGKESLGIIFQLLQKSLNILGEIWKNRRKTEQTEIQDIQLTNLREK